MRPDRAAGHSPASSSTPEGTPPERLPLPCRDPGSSEAGRRSPADVRTSAQHRSTPCRSRCATRGKVVADRPDLERTSLVEEPARGFEHFLEGLAVDDI